MLENYFGTQGNSQENRQRLLAVQAALEIAKASVGSTGAGTQSKVAADLKAAASEINHLADAIQATLGK